MNPWQNPDVRSKVLATVTREEARRTLHSPAGKVWCDELLYLFVDGLADRVDDGTDFGEREAKDLRDSARAVTAPEFATGSRKPSKARL